MAWVLLCGAAPVLAGCSSVPDSINPVSWWHNLEGGEIAKQRPPPPGATEPYPNLATVPAKPEAPDRKALEAITHGLVADRAHAEYMAAATPLSDPSSPSASPALFGQGTMAPPPPASAPGGPAAAAGGSAPVASATMPAATAPLTPPSPPSAAPRRPVESAPLAAPSGSATATQMATAGTAPGAASGASSPAAPPIAAATPPPPVSAAPPPPPGNAPTAAPPVAAAPAPPAVASVSGPPSNVASTPVTGMPAPNPNAPLAPPGAAALPPAASAPPPPIPTTPPAPPKMSGPGAATVTVASASPPLAPAPQGANATTVEFLSGSASLPPGAAAVLKGIAAQRGKAAIAVTGYGDATSSEPDAQSAALSLGLSRAQAVANELAGDGVPAAAVRVGAEAGGRGASVRLVQ